MRSLFGSVERTAEKTMQPIIGGGLFRFVMIVGNAVNRIHRMRGVNRAAFDFKLPQGYTHFGVRVAVFHRVILVTHAT